MNHESPSRAAREAPLADPTHEARRIAAAAEATDVRLRIMGGAAVALRCPSALQPPLDRERSDIDAAARGKQRRGIEKLLVGLGYRGDERFNNFNGETRLLFWDTARERQLDVFLDRFEMCHRIDFAARLEVEGLTLPLAELLLMKLQVVETNEKDLADIAALFCDHDLTEDDTGINLDYLCELLSADWALWRTATMVADRALRFCRGLSLPDGDRAAQRLARMLAAIDATPKTRRWRLRARVGDRVRWYEVPEEVH